MAEVAAGPHRTGDLPPMDVAGRLGRLRRAMAAGPDPVDTLVVSDITNVRYLTGFTGSAATVVVHADGTWFLTDGRYADQAPRQLAAHDVAAEITVARTSDQLKDALVEVVRRVAPERLALEADHVSWNDERRYREWFAGTALVPTAGLVEGLRAVKDPGEVARIEAAGWIADEALATVRDRLGQGITERRFGLELDQAMRDGGALDRSFETIVASGPNGALPHARPGDRVITEGDLVVIDFGAVVDGYCSDMTRTLMVGSPSSTQQRMYEVVRAAQQAGVDAVRVGAGAAEVDRASREVIDDAGWGDAYTHSTGHGVGLLVHEAPRVGPSATAVLAEGNVVTVEPGVYLPDHGGVRIEDTLVVTPSGSRPLTHTPKDPVVVG